MLGRVCRYEFGLAERWDPIFGRSPENISLSGMLCRDMSNPESRINAQKARTILKNVAFFFYSGETLLFSPQIISSKDSNFAESENRAVPYISGFIGRKMERISQASTHSSPHVVEVNNSCRGKGRRACRQKHREAHCGFFWRRIPPWLRRFLKILIDCSLSNKRTDARSRHFFPD